MWCGGYGNINFCSSNCFDVSFPGSQTLSEHWQVLGEDHDESSWNFQCCSVLCGRWDARPAAATLAGTTRTLPEVSERVSCFYSCSYLGWISILTLTLWTEACHHNEQFIIPSMFLKMFFLSYHVSHLNSFPVWYAFCFLFPGIWKRSALFFLASSLSLTRPCWRYWVKQVTHTQSRQVNSPMTKSCRERVLACCSACCSSFD